MTEYAGLLLALICLLGIGAHWLAWWLKLPAILFLLLIGMVAGPVAGLIRPDELFGELLFPMVSLGVAVILFEGALTLRIGEIRGHGDVVRNLVTFGALLNWLLIAAAAWLFMALPAELALLFGALVTVTGPTVIVPLLRTVRPRASVANILRWEGILIDPLGALLAVLVYEFIISGQEGHTLAVFGLVLLAGGVTGAAGAWGLATVLRRHLMPEYLHNVATLALVLGVFATSNALVHESGLLAVTLMGMWLANMKDLDLEDILDFKESLSVLLISSLFIVLAARIEFGQLGDLGWGALGVIAAILFVARPVMVWLSTWGSKLSLQEKALLAWIAPRGIVAAAVSALFALKLEQLGYAEAQLMVTLTFLVIIVTVVVQSATARRVADRLGVSEPEPRGVLIVGGNPVAQAVGKALNDRGFRVVLADTSWENIRAARMAGLQTYFGNVVSQHADRHLDLVGIGRLLAMSRRPALNTLACQYYKSEFGSNRVYSLKMPEERDDSEKRVLATYYRSPRLFGEDIGYTMLASAISKGAEIRATPLTESFDFAAYRAQHGEDVIPLFALDARECLHVFTAGGSVKPLPGWTVLGLFSAEAAKETTQARSAEKKRARNGKAAEDPVPQPAPDG